MIPVPIICPDSLKEVPPTPVTSDSYLLILGMLDYLYALTHYHQER